MIVQNNVVYKIEPSDIKQGRVIIPANTIRIDDCAALNLVELKTVSFPQTCKQLGRSVFANTGIEDFVIPQYIERAADFLFEGCQHLAEVRVLNPDLKIIGNWFNSCPSLRHITHGALKTSVTMFNDFCIEILAKKMVDIYTVYQVKVYKGKEEFYIANKQDCWASGQDVGRAIKECAAKYLTPNLIEKYKDLNLDTPINGLDYKLITGACDKGVDEWLAEEKLTWEDTRIARDILKSLEGRFGYKDFAQFIADRYADRVKDKENK